MSTARPTNKPLHGKRPDFKIRPGMSAEEIEDCRDYCVKHGTNMGAFARRSMLLAIGRTPKDIEEGSE